MYDSFRGFYGIGRNFRYKKESSLWDSPGVFYGIGRNFPYHKKTDASRRMHLPIKKNYLNSVVGMVSISSNA